MLVFIHGYNNSHEIIMQRHRTLKKNLKEKGFKGLLVSFDWPSADHPLNYLEDRSDAKATALQPKIAERQRYEKELEKINKRIRELKDKL